jgi:hypothetical protein
MPLKHSNLGVAILLVLFPQVGFAWGNTTTHQTLTEAALTRFNAPGGSSLGRAIAPPRYHRVARPGGPLTPGRAHFQRQDEEAFNPEAAIWVRPDSITMWDQRGFERS